MRKKTGSYIVTMYDKYDEKEGWTFADNLQHGLAICKEHEQAKAGNTARLIQVLYNSVDNKWEYSPQ